MCKLKQLLARLDAWDKDSDLVHWEDLEGSGGEGGGRDGIGMGNTCKPMAVSFQCMTKFPTNKKKIQFELFTDIHQLVTDSL